LKGDVITVLHSIIFKGMHRQVHEQQCENPDMGRGGEGGRGGDRTIETVLKPNQIDGSIYV
jgi:hypothetical protein